MTATAIASLPASSLAIPGDGADVRFRQLRHHTKNALQAIINILGHAPELRSTREGASLSAQLQERIVLAAQLSDALFGLTNEPGTFEQRLSALCEGVVRLLGDRDAEIAVCVAVGVDGSACPPEHESTVLRVANELVGNAVKHGMHARLIGRIDVSVHTAGGKLVLTVSDNGWGCGPDPVQPGEGLTVAGALAQRHGGAVQVREMRGRTMATMELPL